MTDQLFGATPGNDTPGNDTPGGATSGNDAPLPPELVAERRRIQRLGADAQSLSERRRFRRRALLPAAVVSGVLASTGLVGAWARVTTPAANSTASHSKAASAVPAATGASSEQAFVRQLRRTLAADQQAIAALPQVAASTLSASAGTSAATGPEVGAPSAAGAPAPIPTLPPISVPAVGAAPPVHASTGASGLP